MRQTPAGSRSRKSANFRCRRTQQGWSRLDWKRHSDSVGAVLGFGITMPCVAARMTKPALAMDRKRQTYEQAAVSDRLVQFFEANIQRATLRAAWLLIFSAAFD